MLGVFAEFEREMIVVESRKAHHPVLQPARGSTAVPSAEAKGTL